MSFKLGEVGIKDSEIGEDSRIIEPVNIYGSVIGKNCFVGPFVEVQKDTKIGEGTKKKGMESNTKNFSQEFSL